MPASPYPSCREPTSTVMLTVIVGRDGSGKSSTRAPFSRRYSVTPSTVAISRGGSAACRHGADTQNSTANRGGNRHMATSGGKKPGAKRNTPHRRGVEGAGTERVVTPQDRTAEVTPPDDDCK